MNEANLMFSPDELNLMQDGEWILTKNKVIRKVCELFGLLSEEMKPLWENTRFNDLYKVNRAMISKGENFQGLPYVVLDYPGYFRKENIFSIRCLFWWGNYFSITLHLRGEAKEYFANSLREAIPILAKYDFQICAGDDEWIQELNQKDFSPISVADEGYIKSILDAHAFLKISCKIPFQKMDDIRQQLVTHYGILLESLGHQLPNR